MMEHVIYADKVSCRGSQALPREIIVFLTLTQDQSLEAIKKLAGSLTAEQWDKLAAQVNKEFGL